MLFNLRNLQSLDDSDEEEENELQDSYLRQSAAFPMPNSSRRQTSAARASSTVQFLCCADAQGVPFQMPSFISGHNDQRKSFMNFNSDMSPEIQSDPEKGEHGH